MHYPRRNQPRQSLVVRLQVLRAFLQGPLLCFHCTPLLPLTESKEDYAINVDFRSLHNQDETGSTDLRTQRDISHAIVRSVVAGLVPLTLTRLRMLNEFSAINDDTMAVSMSLCRCPSSAGHASPRNLVVRAWREWTGCEEGGEKKRVRSVVGRKERNEICTW
jgi:hypothetical protein